MEILSITAIIPASVLGVLGVVLFYIYDSYKKKKENQLKEIEGIESDEAKVAVIEMRLNEFGTRIPTDGLTPNQKYNLLKRLIRAKNIRYLIAAIASVVFAIIVTIILSWDKVVE